MFFTEKYGEEGVALNLVYICMPIMDWFVEFNCSKDF